MYKIKKLDLKLLGMIKFIPIIIYLIIIFFCRWLFPNDKNAWLALELLIPYGVTWTSVFYINEMIQNDSIVEILYAWNPEMQKVITIKYLIFTICGGIIGMIPVFFICIPVDFECMKYFILLLLFECMAFSGIGYFLSVCIRNVGWTITLIICILVSDYGTQGRIFGKLHFSLYWYDSLTLDMIEGRMISAFLLAAISFLTGYEILKKTKGRGVLLFIEFIKNYRG